MNEVLPLVTQRLLLVSAQRKINIPLSFGHNEK